MREGREGGGALKGRRGGMVDVHTGVHRARRHHRCEVAVDVLCRSAAYGDGALTDSDSARAGSIRLGCPHAAHVWRRPHEVAVGREVVPHEDGGRGRRRRQRGWRRGRRGRGTRRGGRRRGRGLSVEVHLEHRLLRNRSPGCCADAAAVTEVRHEDPAVIGRAREPPVDARRHVDGLRGHVARQIVDRRAPECLDGRRRKGPRGRGHRQVVVRHGARIPAAAELVHLRLVASVIHGVAEERAGDGSHARERAQVEFHQHEIDIVPAGSRWSGRRGKHV